MAPTKAKTVHETSLLHIESNPDRLGYLSPTHGQRFQQQSGQITLLSVFITVTTPSFSRPHVMQKIRKFVVPRSMAVEVWLLMVKLARERASGRLPKPWASLNYAHLARSPLLVGSCRKTINRGQRSAFPTEPPGSRL